MCAVIAVDLCPSHSPQVRTRYEVYPSTAKECSRLVVVVHDAEVRDRLRVSEINKLLYQNAREGLPKQTHANMVSSVWGNDGLI